METGLYNSPKCDTYMMFKSIPKHETYLTQVKNRKHRIALRKLRVSDHKLMIEEGRKKGPKYLEKVKNTLLQHVFYIKHELS